ncbi:MAG: hypothetical protein V4754_05290 [Pseudomonadota bacterium]
MLNSLGIRSLIAIGAAFLALLIAYFIISLININLDAAFGILSGTFLGTASATVAALIFSGRRGGAVVMILRIVASLTVAMLAAGLAATALLRFASGMSDGLGFCILSVTVIGVSATASIVLARSSSK